MIKYEDDAKFYFNPFFELKNKGINEAYQQWQNHYTECPNCEFLNECDEGKKIWEGVETVVFMTLGFDEFDKWRASEPRKTVTQRIEERMKQMVEELEAEEAKAEEDASNDLDES